MSVLLALIAAASAAPAPAPIVFSRRVRNGSEIYVRARTGRTRRLTSDRSHDTQPAWSPDRRQFGVERPAAHEVAIDVRITFVKEPA